MVLQLYTSPSPNPRMDPFPSLRPARELRAIRSFDAIPFSPLEKVVTLKSRPSSTAAAPERARQTEDDDPSRFQDVSLSDDAQARYSFAESTSSASHSSSSSYSKPFGLSSPFPRPSPVLLPQSTHRPLAQSTKENRRAPPLSFSSALSHHLVPTQHIRVSAKPSSSFFPFRSSILTTSSSYCDLRAGARSPAAFDDYVPRSSEEDGSGGSSDVDLDLSFDFHPSAGYDRAEYRLSPSPVERSPQSAEEGWIGIDMAHEEGPGSIDSSFEEDATVTRPGSLYGGSRRHGVPEGELVRSPSGKLTGVQKRVRSAVELRKAYLDAEEDLRRQEKGKGKDVVDEPEAFAIMMDGGSPARKEGGTARREWVRKTSIDPSLQLGTASRARTDGSTYPRSIGKGFAFNPTDPLSIPLPDSPLTPPSSAAWEGRRSKSFPLPLKRSDRERRGLGSGSSPLASPAWSIGSFFLPSKPRESLDAVALDIAKGTTLEEPSDEARGKEEERSKSPLIWADELAGKTLEYLGMRKKASTPEPAPPTSSVASSPLFGGTTPSDFGMSDDGDSEATTPDSLVFRRIGPLENPVEVGLGVPRAKGGKDDLDGLGLDFTGAEEDSVPPIPPRGVIHTRRLHRTIPSLSISPPPPTSDDGTFSLGDPITDDLAPSKRLTYRPTPRTHRIPSIDATVAREHYSRPPSLIFGPGTDKGAARFSFVPAPLSLVNEQLARNRASTIVVAEPLPPPALRQRPFARISFGEAISIPGTVVDEMIPAKLCFIAGFLFGPWCWILGGWWVRAMDGELWKSRGVRCRTEGCNCGGMVKWHSVAVAQRRGMAERWGGVDQWVFVCRAASVASGSVVLALAVAAIVVAA